MTSLTAEETARKTAVVLPANMQALVDMVGYLETAQAALAVSNDVPTLKEHLVGRYPHYRGDYILDISGRYLYGA